MFTIDELREQFGIIDKYPQYKNFKQKIIEPSILQINKLTDLAVSYNELKFGRKVDKLEFIFEVKKPALPNIRQTDIGVDITDIKPSLSNIDNLLLSIDTELSNTTRELVAKYSKEKGVDYVDASIDYAKKNAKTNLDKYLNDTLVNGWAEVKIKKITETKSKAHAKINALRQDSLKKEQEKEAENLSKSIVEHEWSKLLDNNKANFTSYANFIITKYSKNLSSFKTIHQTLPLCIYAISNGKSYDRMLESYAKNALNLSLNINDMIVS